MIVKYDLSFASVFHMHHMLQGKHLHEAMMPQNNSKAFSFPVFIQHMLQGGDLHEALMPQDNSKARQETFSWYKQGAQIALDVATGLEYLHGRKVDQIILHYGQQKFVDCGQCCLSVRLSPRSSACLLW